MSSQVDQIISAAERYVGIKENPAGSNNVVFNTRYYGRAVTGSQYPWCMAFIYCLFQDIGAPELFFGGGKTASCTTLMNWAQSVGQFVTSGFRRGDIVLYDFDKNPAKSEHVGIVTDADEWAVVAIEGNTAVGNESNGGEVMRRQRAINLVIGAFRPNYAQDDEKTEDDDMTGQDIYNKLNEYMQSQEVPEWAKAELQEAIDMGITDGTNPMSLIPRYQAAIMAKRAVGK